MSILCLGLVQVFLSCFKVQRIQRCIPMNVVDAERRHNNGNNIGQAWSTNRHLTRTPNNFISWSLKSKMHPMYFVCARLVPKNALMENLKMFSRNRALANIPKALTEGHWWRTKGGIGIRFSPFLSQPVQPSLLLHKQLNRAVSKVVSKAFLLRPPFPLEKLCLWSWKPFQDHQDHIKSSTELSLLLQRLLFLSQRLGFKSAGK